MKILISADMEGITGVVNWDQVNPSHAEYSRYRRLMTDDVNAAIHGAFAGGASAITVTDGHGEGSNIIFEELDPRARLTSGSPARYSMVEGVQEDIDGVIFIGYHARKGTSNAILDHTWSDKLVSGLWINQQAFGEAGLNGAVCGHFNVPVIMASGDQSLCAEVRDFFGRTIETAQVKRAVSRFAADCLPPAESSKIIEESARRSVVNLRNGAAPPPFIVSKPVKMAIEFHQSHMADLAEFMPGTLRTDGRRIEFEAADMVTIYHAFISLVALAGQP